MAPPLVWLFGAKEHTNEQVLEVMSEPIHVSLTLNGVEWISLGSFHYFEPKIDWIGIAPQLPSLQVRL